MKLTILILLASVSLALAEDKKVQIKLLSNPALSSHAARVDVEKQASAAQRGLSNFRVVTVRTERQGNKHVAVATVEYTRKK